MGGWLGGWTFWHFDIYLNHLSPLQGYFFWCDWRSFSSLKVAVWKGSRLRRLLPWYCHELMQTWTSSFTKSGIFVWREINPLVWSWEEDSYLCEPTGHRENQITEPHWHVKQSERSKIPGSPSLDIFPFISRNKTQFLTNLCGCVVILRVSCRLFFVVEFCLASINLWVERFF